MAATRHPGLVILLHFDFCASFFKLLFGSVSICLISAFEDRLGGTFDEALGFGQSQAGFDLSNGFDDRNLLLGRNRDKDYIESGLGFRDRSGGASRASSSRDGGSSGDTPLGFEVFDQIGDF